MSSEQITQSNVPVEETTTTTDTPQQTEQTISSTTTEQPTVAKSWKDTISEEFRNDPNISKFTEIDALAKSYINATRMIGQDKVAVPNENSTEDQWQEVYGKLIIIKHNDKFLSAYAYNSEILVKEGDAVEAGQKISRMGQDHTGRKILHFEIRYNGKPVNPLKHLPKNKG